MRYVETGSGAIAVLVVALCAMPAVAKADIVTIISQQRSTNAMVSAPPCGQPHHDGLSESADDFGPFVSDIMAAVNCGQAGATAHTLHESTISPSMLTVEGALHNTAGSEVMALFHSIGMSDYRVTFEVTAPVTFQVEGTIALARNAAQDQMAVPFGEVRLTRDDGFIVFHDQVHVKPDETDLTLDLSRAGSLLPGVYTIRIRAQNIIDAGVPPMVEVTSSFNATMHMNASIPGDLNHDGVVDGADLLILLGAWGECDDPNDCPEDLDGNGVVDGADLLILLGNWG